VSRPNFLFDSAKIRRRKIDEKDSDSSKLEYIKELLETKNENILNRVERTEQEMKELKSDMKEISRSISEVNQRLEDGFLGIHERLNKHIDNHSQIQPKPYTGQERRGGNR
jgi:RNA polymerase-binding transcription factor DksA